MREIYFFVFLFIFVGCGNSKEITAVIQKSAEEEILYDTDFIILNELSEQSETEEIEAEETTLPSTRQISERGLASARYFLIHYISLYSYGTVNVWDDTGEGIYIDYRNHWYSTNERPLVIEKFNDSFVWYDRFDIPIRDAVYIRGDLYAAAFELYDFDNDGIPEIIIHWVKPDSYIREIKIYRYTDGQYEEAGDLPNAGYSFYYDTDERVYVIYNNDHDGYYASGYLTFTDSGIEHVVNEDNLPFYEWYAHHAYPAFEENPTIFGTDMPLTRILPLDDVRDELLALFRAEIRGLPDGFYIYTASDELLSHFDIVHEMDFRQTAESRGQRDYTGDNLIFWTDYTISGIEFVLFTATFRDDEVFFIPSAPIGSINVLPSGNALFIHSYIELGETMPTSGIGVTDENGIRRYFAVIQDSRGDPHDPPYYLMDVTATIELPV